MSTGMSAGVSALLLIFAASTGPATSANTTISGARFCNTASPCGPAVQCIQGLCFCLGVLWTAPLCVTPPSFSSLLQSCTLSSDCASSSSSAATPGGPTCGSSGYCYTPCADDSVCTLGATAGAACVGGMCICTLDNTIKVGDCSSQSKVIFQWWMAVAALAAILVIILIVVVVVCRRKKRTPPQPAAAAAAQKEDAGALQPSPKAPSPASAMGAAGAQPSQQPPSPKTQSLKAQSPKTQSPKTQSPAGATAGLQPQQPPATADAQAADLQQPRIAHDQGSVHSVLN